MVKIFKDGRDGAVALARSDGVQSFGVLSKPRGDEDEMFTALSWGETSRPQWQPAPPLEVVVPDRWRSEYASSCEAAKTTLELSLETRGGAFLSYSMTQTRRCRIRAAARRPFAPLRARAARGERGDDEAEAGGRCASFEPEAVAARGWLRRRKQRLEKRGLSRARRGEHRPRELFLPHDH